MTIRVVVHEGETIPAAFKKLKRQIQRQAPSERYRRRWWGNVQYEKPCYQQRQKEYFARCNAQKYARLHRYLS